MQCCGKRPRHTISFQKDPAMPNLKQFATRRATPIALALGLLAGPVLAGPDSHHEHPQEKAELHESQHELRDDRQDLAQLHTLVEEWHRARARRDRGAERRADEGLERWMKKELAEAKTEVREAQQEVQESKTEVRKEQRDAHRAQHRGKNRQAVRERAEVRGDKADLADDKRDLTEQRQDLNRLNGIARDLESIQHHFRGRGATHAQYARKSALLRQIQTLARDEVQDSKSEIKEDRQELREGKHR
jgi:hypothetical protein